MTSSRITLASSDFFCVEPSNLLEIQKNSYEKLLEGNGAGIFQVLKPYFPVVSPDETIVVDLLECSIVSPQYSPEFCKSRGITYQSEVTGLFNIVKFSYDADTGVKEVLFIKKQSVFLFNLPLMINDGSFVVNGVEKVIVPQMHRAPGIVIQDNKNAGGLSYSARILPYNGAWIEFEIDQKNNIFTRLNGKRKLGIVPFLFALGYSLDDLISLFFTKLKINLSDSNPDGFVMIERDALVVLKNKLAPFSIFSSEGEMVCKSETRLNDRTFKKLPEKCYVEFADVTSFYLNQDIATGRQKTAYKRSSFVELDLLKDLSSSSKPVEVEVLISTYLFNAQFIAQLFNSENSDIAGLRELYRVVRPGNPFSQDDALKSLNYLFFNPKYYNLSDVGRYRLNNTLGLDIDKNTLVLTKEDIVATIKLLLEARYESKVFKNLDSLENRRVKAVGEIVTSVIRGSIGKLTKYMIDKLVTAKDTNQLMPSNLISSNIILSDLRDFFLLSELSHFMDATNPLAELSHKRRISALGPGGLERTRAGFEVRDVDATHYGRICPIETPEGQNIGLVMSLASFAKLNEYGFLCAPYRVVKEAVITDEIVYLDPENEKKHVIASFAKDSIKGNKIITDRIVARKHGEFITANVSDVEYIEYVPRQLISVAASLIPFIENDDAGRALMGSNMQRQALPLINSTPPLIGTGIEKVFIQNSNTVVKTNRKGIVTKIFSNKIFVSSLPNSDEQYIDVYTLRKFNRSNQNNIISQSAIVKIGQIVDVNQVLSSGQSTDGKELALGRNVLIGYMTWHGYNFEDAIILSERIVNKGLYTSIHIEEYTCTVRDTRLGPEEVTRDIPGYPTASLEFLDESGVIREGTVVKAGDILVGKVTPKTQDLLTPEERLLKAIFGERGGEISDSSLVLPPGAFGTVIKVEIITKRGIPKIKRALQIEENMLTDLSIEKNTKNEVLDDIYRKTLIRLLQDAEFFQTSLPKALSKKYGKLTVLTEELLNEMSLNDSFGLKLVSAEVAASLAELKDTYTKTLQHMDNHYNTMASGICEGDDLPQGTLAAVKVYVAVQRVIQPGDKMAGRHGNKGVVSKIVPIEDMPFLQDGTPLDMLLSPLGIPQRMNVGQVFETHLGLVAHGLGKQIDRMLIEKTAHTEIKSYVKDVLQNEVASRCLDALSKEELKESLGLWAKSGVKFACQSFDGVKSDQIENMLEKLGFDKSGQAVVYDGVTGEPYHRKITVGYKYMLKLHHIVDEKIHARSVGSYSLVTQQPLGGRSNFGGQRFGEMECWSVQAYGAAYTLQEMLTIKSDDVIGRTKMYESIVRGDFNFSYNAPESFNVLIKQLRSLCLNIQVAENEEVLAG